MTLFAQVKSADVFQPPLFARGVAFCAFTDVNEQARAFDGWDLNYIQISGGTFHGSSSIVTLGGIRLLVESLDKVILQQGAVPTDRLAFAVPLELEGHARMCGEKSGRDSLHVFSSLSQFEFYSPEHHVLVNVEIEPDKLHSEPMRVLAASLRARVLSPVVPMSCEAAENLRTLLRQIMAASTESSGTRDDEVDGRLALLERTVLFAISEVAQDVPQDGGRGRTTRHWALVNSVQERLQDPATCPLTIAELCVQLDMCRRTLQYAFREALDLNPVAYLRAVRLNHVRRELRLGESVTTAATRWGFWHLGNFAQDYRAMFGELPSVTSRRYARKDV
ncbi:MAG TPA: helix-turn-helix domain-containing protein [Paraburkholderia sp.]|uniref:helix-turn-helix domain-containing protein n=1 Tax=Paraburkholderia sp. TaxID=1926495 RepID=UPI002B45B1E8|nr:helix-turn-helix domain-containing protein [Paraburkholderia sp.]HKR40533.1 helix-turn-helix domain-containing protein [Paraburkholderia sp.]